VNEQIVARPAPAGWLHPVAQATREGFRKTQPVWVSNQLWWGLVIIGGALRLITYLLNRSLWRDEAALAMNIIDRSYAGLLEPLDSYQAAPLGFLMLEKTAVLVFGTSEYALRLMPLIAGTLALVLFKPVAELCLRPVAVPIALAFFAVSEKLIYYSSEVKQYAFDVLIALLIIWLALRIYSSGLSLKRAAWFGLVGAIGVWFSHPAIFVLAGVGVCLFTAAVYKRDWRSAVLLGGAGALWLVSFRLNYKMALRATGESGFLLTFWSEYDAFMPFPPFSIAAVKWLWHSFFLTMQDPAGFSFPVIAGPVFIIGCSAALVKRDVKLLLLLAPIPIALLASGLRKYPLLERLLLFLVPVIVLMITRGIDAIARKAAIAGAALATLLLVHPVVHSVTRPPVHEDIKPLLGYIRDHREEGDAIFVDRLARHSFHYYATRYGFEEFDLLRGGHKKRSKVEDVGKRFRDHERVWVLQFVFNPRELEAEQAALEHLDSIGARLDTYREKGVAVYLYELNKGAVLPDNQPE
jgi:hypothetical protein